MANATSQTQLLGNVHLTHLAAMDVKGVDAERFLQGQTSAQVSLANGHFAPLTCFCTPKGRMIANGQLLRLGEEHYRLIMSATLLDMLTGHLQKFAAFYRTELIPQTSLTFIGASETAQSLANTIGLALPEQPYTQQCNQQACVLRVPGHARWLFCLHTPADIDVSDDEQARNTWQLEDIRSGLAWLTDAQQDHFLPQMLNWEALGGISFKKGCYTGQEVVARAHFRGQVKKRLVHAKIATSGLPDAGEVLHDNEGKSVGEVVNSAFSDPQHIELLAVMNTKVIEGEQDVFLDGHPVTLYAPPYAIERQDPEQLALAVTK